MQTLKDFVFFKDATTAQTSNPYYIAQGEEMTIQISGPQDEAFEIFVQAKTDKENGEFVNVAAIDMSVFKIAKTITACGIYVVAISGFSCVRLVINSISGSEGIFASAKIASGN